MNITNNARANNPSFGKVIKQSNIIYNKLLQAGNSYNMVEYVINTQRTNHAADIILTKNNAYVVDKFTGDTFYPTGKSLQVVTNKDYVDLLELELEKHSSPQREDADKFARKYFLGTKLKKKGFLNYVFEKLYFQRKSPTSYIAEQKLRSDEWMGRNKPDEYFHSSDKEFDKIVSKVNACLDIAHDLYEKAIATGKLEKPFYK